MPRYGAAYSRVFKLLTETLNIIAITCNSEVRRGKFLPDALENFR